jgi:hypothetical protein
MILQSAEESVHEANDLEDVRLRYRRLMDVGRSTDGTDGLSVDVV